MEKLKNYKIGESQSKNTRITHSWAHKSVLCAWMYITWLECFSKANETYFLFI